MKKPIQIIQGAQWGSEAKGTIAAYLALRDDVQVAVRTGAINAGHTVYHEGTPYAMQQIPVAWVKPDCTLVIGAGAYIQPEVLAKEISTIIQATGLSPVNRLIIDDNAGLHLPSYADESKAVNRHHAIGATGKGCAEAIVHKIKERNQGYQLFREWLPNSDYGWLTKHFQFADTRKLLTGAYHAGAKIQLEGTQGELLDFHFGPYPYTTSRQTIAAAWVAEAGLSPAFNYEVCLVARTYPIRVAGNSGPMGEDEITWPTLARRMNLHLHQAGMPEIVSEPDLVLWEEAMAKVAKAHGAPDWVWKYPYMMTTDTGIIYRRFLSEGAKEAFAEVGPEVEARLRKLFEVTTVTKKLRRIARLDVEQLALTCAFEGASYIALTFMNYVFPEIANTTPDTVLDPKVNEIIKSYVSNLEADTGTPVRLINTGPLPEHIHENYTLGY